MVAAVKASRPPLKVRFVVMGREILRERPPDAQKRVTEHLTRNVPTGNRQ